MPFQEARDAADAHERYVWVDDDGSVRELSPDECAYLATPFEGFDSGRPYVKERYRSLTPDKRMRGFLELRHLPRELRHRVRRGGSAPRPAPRRFPGRRVLGSALGTILVTLLAGYLAYVAGAFIALPFTHPGRRGLGVVLFVVAAFAGIPYYFIAGPLNLLLTADATRLLRFLCVTALYLGALAGAAWILWLHGDPARILLHR